MNFQGLYYLHSKGKMHRDIKVQITYFVLLTLSAFKHVEQSLEKLSWLI